MSKQDYYKTLNVSKDATIDEIRKSFRKLSKLHHPDTQVGKSATECKASEEKFKEIAEAYEVLSDKDKRAKYDHFGFDKPKTSNPSGFDEFNTGGFSFNDFMRNYASSASPNFDFRNNSDTTQKKQPNFNLPETGSDIQTKIELTFKEAVNGCEKTFNLKLSKECPECHGSGVEDDSVEPEICTKCHGNGRIVHMTQHGYMISQTVTTCPHCNGTGYQIKYCKKCKGEKRVSDVKHITVKIPSGIDDGQRVRIIGSGQCGVKGGANGNLYILISIQKQNIFERNKLDVNTKIYIDPITATLGGTVSIATPYKMIDIDIPTETQTGAIIVKKGEGIKSANSVGDLHIEICIEAYSKLTNNQKKALETIKNKFTDNNRLLNKKYLQDAQKLI